ncbi:MAG TPA: hypothetical protein VG125_09760 [Pirellulales bacterium]|nr:hypothetical protein [Pirellulales bacterium]
MQHEAPIAESGRLRLWSQAVGAMAWLAVMAALSGYSFLVMYAATVCAALGTCALSLMWLVPWAMNPEARPKQFRLASLLYFITLAAVYLATIRWVVVHVEMRMREEGVNEALPWYLVLAVAGGLTLFLLIACPWVLYLAESLMWLAVWLVHWPPARGFIRLCLRRRKE